MFRVDWTPAALAELAEIWADAGDATRRRITEATREIDAQLAAAANEAGESRIENIRLLFVPPLSVYFHVHEDSRTAAVFQVSQLRKRGR